MNNNRTYLEAPIYNPSSSYTTTPQKKVTTPKSTVVPQNPSAVNPNLKTPQAQAFIQSQYSSSNTTPTSSQAGSALTQNIPTEPVKSDPYLEFLRSQFNPKEVGRLANESKSANMRLADIQSENERAAYEARKGYEANLDRVGGLKSGAEQSAQVYNRRASNDLADLSLRETAAARTATVAQAAYQDALNAGKTVFEAEREAEKAQKEEERNNKEFAFKQDQAQFENSLAEKKFEEDKRQFGMQYALEQKKINLQSIKDATEEKQIQNEANQAASQSLGIVNNLLSDDKYTKITGAGQNPLNVLGISNADSINQYNQLQGLLKLGIRKLIKGQGQISDYEGKILGQAASNLGRNLSNDEFGKALKQIRGVIKTNNGQSTTVVVTDKNGKKHIGDLTGPEIYEAVSDGNTVEYK